MEICGNAINVWELESEEWTECSSLSLLPLLVFILLILAVAFRFSVLFKRTDKLSHGVFITLQFSAKEEVRRWVAGRVGERERECPVLAQLLHSVNHSHENSDWSQLMRLFWLHPSSQLCVCRHSPLLLGCPHPPPSLFFSFSCSFCSSRSVKNTSVGGSLFKYQV